MTSQMLLVDKFNITTDSLENEFKSIINTHKNDNITELHSSYTIEQNKNNTYTLNHSTHLNGSFLETIIFREKDDTFISFECNVVLISPFNLTQFWNLYELYKNTYNILIDSRLQIIIMYAALAYADEILIYNSFTTRIMNLFDYCSDLFKISAFELNIRQIQELFIMKMIISFYLRDCNIQWQVNQIISNLKELHRYEVNEVNKKSIIDIMMNYIKCVSIDEVNKQNVTKLYQLFGKYFSLNVFKFADSEMDDIILSKWKIDNLKLEDVYMSFVLLKRSNFLFVKNDNM